MFCHSLGRKKCKIKLLSSHLHHDFESVQRRRAGPGDGSGSSACDQVPPPHPSLLLLNGEVIRYQQVLTDIKYLHTKQKKQDKFKFVFFIYFFTPKQVKFLRNSSLVCFHTLHVNEVVENNSCEVDRSL